MGSGERVGEAYIGGGGGHVALEYRWTVRFSGFENWMVGLGNVLPNSEPKRSLFYRAGIFTVGWVL